MYNYFMENEIIYQKTAKQKQVTTEDIDCEMREAIRHACKSPTALINQIPHKGEMPTADEVTAYFLAILMNGGFPL